MSASFRDDDKVIIARIRGTISKDGRVASSCSSEWLHGLCLEMHRARSFAVVDLVQSSDKQAQRRRLQLLIQEMRRLLGYPELFPSPKVRLRFLSLLALDAEFQFHEACKGRLLRSEEESLERFSREELTRPDYMPWSRGWENFLLNMAPGAPRNHGGTSTPKSTFQVIPSVGMRICTDLEREEHEIVRFVRKNKADFLDITRAKSTLLVDFDKPEQASELFPVSVLQQQSATDTAQPSPFQDHQRIRLDLPFQSAAAIEGFGAFIYRMDYPAPLPHMPVAALNGPDRFASVTLRTWHHPYKLSDLQFQNEQDEQDEQLSV